MASRYNRLGIGKFTHAFPGEHYALVRPLRDDLRRSIVEVPRRAIRRQGRQRQRTQRKITKSQNKMLLKDTHAGKPTKTGKPKQAPRTMAARPPGSKEIRVLRNVKAPHVVKATGVEVHRPRVLSPHPPRLYHVLPIQRIYQHVKDH